MAIGLAARLAAKAIVPVFCLAGYGAGRCAGNCVLITVSGWLILPVMPRYFYWQEICRRR